MTTTAGDPASEDPGSCGQGLAEHAAIPAKLAELLDSLAENLEAHLPSLDLGDPNARAERDAYVRLAQQHRQIAAQLQATAREMAGYRTLPMGRHDPQTVAAPQVIKAFERYVRIEKELGDLFRSSVEQDEDMLAGMDT